MKTYNIVYQDKEHLENFLNSIESLSNNSVLTQIFSGVSDKNVLKNIINTIQKRFDNQIIIGASTAGEIFEGEMLEQSIVICISIFESVSLLSYSEKGDDSFLLGKNIAKNIVTEDTKAVILFADGVLCNGEAILKGFESIAHKGIIISGGMAGDNNKYQQTFVIDNNNILKNGAIAVSLNSKTLIVHNSYSLAWKPIGLPMTITKADGNTIYEIDNKPIVEVYRDYLGEDIVEKLPASAIEFPLLFENDGVLVARSMIKVNNNSISFAGEIPVGMQVKFGVANTKSFMQERNTLFQTNRQFPIESLFVYSCVARKMFLGKDLTSELKPLSDIATMSGFFTFGEFYSGKDDLEMLNITTTLLSLSESTSINKEIQEPSPLQKDLSLSTTALIHLVEKSIAQLEATSEKKEDLIIELNQYQKAINTTFLVSKTDTKGIITYVNDQFCQISGYTKEELMGHPHNTVRHPDMPKEAFKDLWKTIQSKKMWHGIVQNRNKYGKSYYVDATIFPILNKDGQIIEYVATRKDITEIKSQQQRTEEILNAEDSIVLLTSVADEITNTQAETKQLNEKFFQLFDYKDTEAFLKEHKCICELFVNRDGYLAIDMDGKLWIEYLLENQNNSHLAIMIDKFGKERIFSVKAKLINLDTQDFIITTFSDVTELEEARVKALNAEKTKAAFLATMSHELRTPLNAIIGFSQILMLKSDMPEQTLKTYMEKINISGNHLLSLVNDILDFSKLESEKMDLHLEKTNLAEIFDEVVMMLESTAEKKDITIEKEYPKNVIFEADKKLLKQVVINIIGNAIKFTPEGKKITLGYVQDQKLHHLTICDEGIGVTQEQIAIMFDPFSQIAEHQKETIKGTGLGLSISKKIMHLHHGDITVTSKLNEGSCFTLTLPK